MPPPETASIDLRLCFGDAEAEGLLLGALAVRRELGGPPSGIGKVSRAGRPDDHRLGLALLPRLRDALADHACHLVSGCVRSV